MCQPPLTPHEKLVLGNVHTRYSLLIMFHYCTRYVFNMLLLMLTNHNNLLPPDEVLTNTSSTNATVLILQ